MLFKPKRQSTWSEVDQEIKRLSNKELLKAYSEYLSLCAKDVKQLKLERMLEEELHRRSVK